MILDTAVRPRQHSIALRLFQHITEISGGHGESQRISRPSVEQPARGNTGRIKDGQLLQVRVRSNGKRAEHADAAIVRASSEWDDDLIEQAIKAPTTASADAGLEIGE